MVESILDMMMYRVYCSGSAAHFPEALLLVWSLEMSFSSSSTTGESSCIGHYDKPSLGGLFGDKLTDFSFAWDI